MEIGTTKKGIGPAYSSKANRTGLRIADLVGDFASFETKFKELVKSFKHKYPELFSDYDEQIQLELKKVCCKYQITSAECVQSEVLFSEKVL